MADNHNEVLVERDGGIAWITLNRPDQLNAMNTALLHRLGEVIDDLGADEQRPRPGHPRRRAGLLGRL